ncbi:Endoplasmic reticulum oxidoreductin-2 [Ananas comosus]|uniref:Endoplasmic reticulum oxidoreductin-2 n=1 Tax=Ananas comosus TaxID=4615 RepID=A0A199VXH5_ANACO|nr:Endoplasmic reticulum oxidoreductin-2 [Ananas comosus]
MLGHNLELLCDRVLKYPDRVRNLYFTFLFFLRAVTKGVSLLRTTCGTPNYVAPEHLALVIFIHNLIALQVQHLNCRAHYDWI